MILHLLLQERQTHDRGSDLVYEQVSSFNSYSKHNQLDEHKHYHIGSGHYFCQQEMLASALQRKLHFIFIYDTHYSKVLKDCCIKEKAENFFNKKSISKHFVHDTSQALYSEDI